MPVSSDGPPGGPTPPDLETPSEHGTPPEHEQPHAGGDAVCWLERVCDRCGALDDGPPTAVCERCGAPRST